MTRRKASRKKAAPNPAQPPAPSAATPRSLRRWWIGGFVVLASLGIAAVVLPRSKPHVPITRGKVVPRLDQQDPSTWSPVKKEFAAIAARIEDSDNMYLGRRPAKELRAMLELGSGRVDMMTETTIRLQLWSHLLRLGEVDEATAMLESVFRQVEGVPLYKEQQRMLLWNRTLNYLRLGEVRNCVQRHNADCCILPLRGGGVHAEPMPAEEARKSLQGLLALYPDSLQYLWLLNVTSMAVGDYPMGVPGPYLIPERTFESEQDVGRFLDIAPILGVDTFSLCGGAITEDFDNDGFIDIVTSAYDPGFPVTYYRNLGNGAFEELTESSALGDQLGGLNIIHGDYDNDGDQDILVLRGAWLFDDGRLRKSLLRNNGDLTFTDVTREAGLASPAQPTQTATWIDYDADGDLDLYVGAESRIHITNDGDYPSQLFRNNGNGTFTDVAKQAGVTNDGYCKGVAAGDYDNDGDMDLYVSNVGTNRLYRNNGNGTFTDVAGELGVQGPGVSFATWFFDYDNDGWLDLYVGAFDATLADVAADYLRIPQKGSAPALYRNLGNGTFKDVAREVNLDHPYTTMGANFGDIDNDGFLDMYLATGRPGYEFLVPNILLRNDASRRFVDVTTSAGVGNLQKGHGVAFADVDNDGDQDIYEQLGGFYPGDTFRNALFENPGHGRRFVVVRLVGTRSNRDAVGARIEVVTESGAGTKSFHRAVGCVSSFGGSPRRQEIGLGDATRIAEVRVRWPHSTTVQVVRNVPLDAFVEITEGKDGFKQRRYSKVTFEDTRVARR